MERRLLRVPDPRFDFPLTIRIADAARQSDDAIVGEHVPIQRIECGLVHVGREDALFETVEHDDASGATQPRPLLTERQAQTVDALKEHCPGFTTMRRLVLSFRTILRVGTVTTLHRWVARALATNIHALQRFVRKLRQDLGAVEGRRAGAVEQRARRRARQRLKMLRRQMYGRAGVKLLRARVLPVPPAAPC